MLAFGCVSPHHHPLIDNWGLGGRSAALDVSYPFKHEIKASAGTTAGSATVATENRNLSSNGPTCDVFGMGHVLVLCGLLWHLDKTFSGLVAQSKCTCKAIVPCRSNLYGKLSCSLVHSNARAFWQDPPKVTSVIESF